MLADLSREPGPLAFETPGVRFSRALPGPLGCLERGGTGLDVFAAPVPAEESVVGS